MQTFKNRIKYYLIGLTIGLLFTFAIFGNRGCEWLPDNRVKNMIAEKEIIVGDSVLDIMNCQGLRNDHVYALLNDAGDVDYGKSNTHILPKEYHIEGELEDYSFFVRYALGDSIVEVLDARKDNKSCSSTLSNDHKQTLPLPHDDVVAILESHEFRILSKARCQMKIIGMSEDEMMNFHKTADILIDKSEPRLSPNPFYIMEGEYNGLIYQVKYIVGENRTRISEILDLEGCED